MDVLARLAELEAWADRQGGVTERVPYGDGTEQFMEKRLPARPGPHLTAVLLHGGFWRAAFTLSTTRALAVDLNRRGYITWNVEYRRVGNGGGVPVTQDDVTRALRQIDATELLVIGHSAGGQLALRAAGEPNVTTVLSLAGVCDLRTAAEERIGDGATLEFAGGTPAERPAEYAAADPLQHLPTQARVMLAHGTDDDRVPVEQSRTYARASGCEFLELADVDHFAVIDPRTDAWARIAPLLTS